jgi:hypothetical protein
MSNGFYIIFSPIPPIWSVDFRRAVLDAYEALGVPEIWRYENNKLEINVLEDGKYVGSEISPTFPNLSIIEAISQYCEQSQTVGTSKTLRLFRKWVREQITL